MAKKITKSKATKKTAKRAAKKAKKSGTKVDRSDGLLISPFSS